MARFMDPQCWLNGDRRMNCGHMGNNSMVVVSQRMTGNTADFSIVYMKYYHQFIKQISINELENIKYS